MTARQLIHLLCGRPPGSRVRVATPTGAVDLRADVWVTEDGTATPDVLLVPAGLTTHPDLIVEAPTEEATHAGD